MSELEVPWTHIGDQMTAVKDLDGSFSVFPFSVQIHLGVGMWVSNVFVYKSLTPLLDLQTEGSYVQLKI